MHPHHLFVRNRPLLPPGRLGENKSRGSGAGHRESGQGKHRTNVASARGTRAANALEYYVDGT